MEQKPQCEVIKADGKFVDGTCPVESFRNKAESYQFLAAGIWFSKKFGRAIPLPPAPASTSGDLCPTYDDSYDWDDGGYDAAVVSGQVQFGDSFAAGMGIGDTSKDACRLGSNNFGQLLHDVFVDGFPYQNLACSGDTIAGLYDKLSGWTNPTQDNLATLSIGGNDVGFANIVKHCILRYYNSFALWDAPWCAYYKRAARNLIADTSADGLQYRLTSIYLRIIGKIRSNPVSRVFFLFSFYD